MSAAAGASLAGRRIVVTRRPEQAGALTARLRALGADVVELPTVAIGPPEDWAALDGALRDLHRYDWLVVTSANAVAAVADRLESLGLGRSTVGRGTAVASVGPATTEALLARFPDATVDLQPVAEFRAEGLAEALTARPIAGQRFLLPVSDRARPFLREALAAAGARVDAVVAYRTLPPEQLREHVKSLIHGGFDALVFASPSAVENLAKVAGEAVRALPAAVIGPVTEAAARKAGLDVRVVAEPSTADGLVAGLVRLLGTRPS
jgi:uroporphyrinogen III methyltransferase/synthase